MVRCVPISWHIAFHTSETNALPWSEVMCCGTQNTGFTRRSKPACVESISVGIAAVYRVYQWMTVKILFSHSRIKRPHEVYMYVCEVLRLKSVLASGIGPFLPFGIWYTPEPTFTLQHCSPTIPLIVSPALLSRWPRVGQIVQCFKHLVTEFSGQQHSYWIDCSIYPDGLAPSCAKPFCLKTWISSELCLVPAPADFLPVQS